MPGICSWKLCGKVVWACWWKVSSKTRSLRGQLWAVIFQFHLCQEMSDAWLSEDCRKVTNGVLKPLSFCSAFAVSFLLFTEGGICPPETKFSNLVLVVL